MLLLKWGGEEIYVGPLGYHSSHLIEYFEVRLLNTGNVLSAMHVFGSTCYLIFSCMFHQRELVEFLK